MYQRQTLLLGALLSGVLCAPLFVFAQTSTSTAEQPTIAIDAFRQKVDEFIKQKIAEEPTPEESLSKAVGDSLEVKLSPPSPTPNKQVRVTITSYLTDLNKASIVWTLNDKPVLQGVGERVFTFKNGPSGEKTKLSVSIITSSGEIITKDLSMTPVGVTIFWEADTYTPPFYKGKPLLSPQAKIKIVATPDNTGTKNALGAGELVYAWEKNGSMDAANSGYGKNTYSFFGPKPYSSSNMKVKVSSVDDSVKSETMIDLSLSSPFIIFYENSPLLGTMFNKPFKQSANLASREISLNAVPYFFSNDEVGEESLNFVWSVNGRQVQNEGGNIVLRNDAGAKGSSLVSLSVNNTLQTFQTARKDLRINFVEDSTNKPLF